MSQTIDRILVVEDDGQYAALVVRQLELEGFAATHCGTASAALELLSREQFDLIITDILMPGMSGLDLLLELESRAVKAPVIVMSAFGSLDTAVRAMKRGAYDYIAKPFQKDEMILAIRKLEERESLRRKVVLLEEKLRQGERFGEIVGGSEKMQALFALVLKVAPFRSTVLVSGESGTGKELIARAIHAQSPRSGQRFVALNCAAIPENLLESELFGHVRGAFTDAHADRKGLFEEADQGTLFLDEIGELPLGLQVKLLRVLQDGEVRRIGAGRSAKVDVRVVAATARTLDTEVKEGRFREDLYYRLNVVQLHLPPLRERLQDIEPLVRHFIDKTNARLGTQVKGIDDLALKAMLAYSWPGNVRELENVVERCLVLSDGAVVGVESLPPQVAGARSERGPLNPDDLSIKKATRRLESEYIRAALLKTGGNRTQAARLLELSHRALLYKIQDYGIDIPPP